jgi:multicomponent Na+:H+ antiporter subunit G
MEYLIAFSLLSGSFFILLSALGVLRFPDLFTRMHAAAKAATFGTGLMLLGTIFYFRSWAIIIESLLITVFIFLTMPVASHLIARAAYHMNIKLWNKSVIDEWHNKETGGNSHE